MSDLNYSNAVILSHPMIEHKMTIIRDKNASTKQFWQNVKEVALLLAYKVSENFLVKEVSIETPICSCIGKTLANEILLVPILRAGLGFVDGFREVIPEAKIGFLGMFRNEETLEPVEYFTKLPSSFENTTVVICDPMLATGGSAIAAIDAIVKRGATDIIFAGLVGAPEGILALQKKYPFVKIVLATLDEKLNEKGYIVPGLGDCGDRLFGN